MSGFLDAAMWALPESGQQGGLYELRCSEAREPFLCLALNLFVRPAKGTLLEKARRARL
jgi:hypothetical protein